MANWDGDEVSSSQEEVLLIAKQEEVDMVLLGGDLFHDNKPFSGQSPSISAGFGQGDVSERQVAADTTPGDESAARSRVW